jgi:hypothetical protein
MAAEWRRTGFNGSAAAFHTNNTPTSTTQYLRMLSYSFGMNYRIFDSFFSPEFL